MHNTQSRLPANDNDVVMSIATIGTFEAVVFFPRICDISDIFVNPSIAVIVRIGNTVLCQKGQPHKSLP